MTTSNSFRIGNVQIAAGQQVVYGEATVRDGVITAVTAAADAAPSDDSLPYIDGQGGWLLPGFIDIHVHGGYGSDFMDATEEAYDAITKFHSAHGTTSILATTVTASPERIEAVLTAAASYRAKEMQYADLAGVHLEGPFISEKWPGAQNPAFIVPPQTEWLEKWIEKWPSLIKILTLAPEKDGALRVIDWLTAHGIVASLGHTDATYEEVVTAVQHGLRHGVHTYNAMTGLHHRKPGTLGAMLTEDAITAELIADGHHVHPAAIQVLTRTKPSDKLVLITDAMSAAGLGDGLYDLGGLAVNVKDGVATLAEGNSLAGSTLTMIQAFRFMLQHTGLSVPEVSRLASANPAKAIGIDSYTGTIEVGKRADLVWTDGDHNLLTTWVKGKAVYRAQ